MSGICKSRTYDVWSNKLAPAGGFCEGASCSGVVEGYDVGSRRESQSTLFIAGSIVNA